MRSTELISRFSGYSILLSLSTTVGLVVPVIASGRCEKETSTDRKATLGSFEVQSYAGGPSAKLVAARCNDLQHRLRAHLLRQNGKWELFSGMDPDAVTTVRLEHDLAWRLFTKGVSAEAAQGQVQIRGDRRLGSGILDMVSIMT